MAVVYFVLHYLVIIVFTVALTCAIILRNCGEDPLSLPIILYFSIMLINEMQIYYTEAPTPFSSLINTTFVGREPVFKSIVLITSAICLVIIENRIINRKFSIIQGSLLALLSSWFLALSMLSIMTKFIAWLYIMPYQIFYFLLAIHGLRSRKADSYALSERPDADKRFLFVLKITLLFSFLILFEDTYSNLFIDLVNVSMFQIKQRNFCEDALHVVYSVVWINYTIMELRNLISKRSASNVCSRFDSRGSEAQYNLMGEHRKHGAPAFPNEKNSRSVPQFASSLNLTEREEEILSLLLEDKNNQEISERLFISIGTVKTHVHNIFQKADVMRRSELIRCFELFHLGDSGSLSPNRQSEKGDDTNRNGNPPDEIKK